jgi:hypothetical protein
MDGASNEWMARKIKRIVEAIAPKTIVVQWSYFTRRELPSNTDDEKRIMQYNPLQLEDEINIENFKNCVLETTKICKNCQIINSIIPDAFSGIDVKEVQGWWWGDKESSWPAELPLLFTDISSDILQQLKKKQQYNKYFIHYTLQDFIKNNNMILVDQLDEFFVKDLARDGHHYGIATVTKFVNEVQAKFKLV